MTYAKTTAFEKDLQELSQFARVLSHPARLAILQYLSKNCSCISGDISNQLPLSRTTVSQHLKELKKAGLIRSTVRGVQVIYHIEEKELEKFRKLFDDYLIDLQKQFECSCKIKHHIN